MGKLHACFVVAILALAAGCDGDNAAADAAIKLIDAGPDAKVFMDAPPPVYDFSCLGNAAPTMATAQITLSGSVTRVSLSGTTPQFNDLDGALIKACVAGTACGNNANEKKGEATSAGGGNFSIGPFNTSMAPQDLFLEMTENTSRTIYVYPASPFIADQAMIPVLTFDPAAIPLLQFIGCTQTAGNGMLGLVITDCANAPITDMPMLSVKQGGNEVTGTTVLDLGTYQAEAAGTYLVCNVPPNNTTTVGATYNGMMLRAHDVKVVAGTTTTTLLRPGY